MPGLAMKASWHSLSPKASFFVLKSRHAYRYATNDCAPHAQRDAGDIRLAFIELGHDRDS